MKLIIHDLDKELEEKIIPRNEDYCVINSSNRIFNCIGCFGCWIKTPGKCVIKDEYNKMGELLGKCDELVVISKCFYGGYSPFVKNVMDRSIPYIHPYFTVRNGEMHHRRRYDNHIKLDVFFYGENITSEEKNTANNIIKGNVVNFDADLRKINFLSKIEDLEGVI